MSVWLTYATSESNINETDNRSTLNLTIYVNWDWGSYNWMSPPGTVTIEGTDYSFNQSFNLNGTSSGREVLWSGSQVIPHNSDGSKTASFSAWYDTEVSSGQISISGTKVLSTIPRASQPTLSPSTITMGSGMQIVTNRQSQSFTHTLEYEVNGRKSGIASDVGASTIWTVPLTLANYVPNSTSGKGTINCKTYNGSKLIGTKSTQFTANVPSTVVPTISTITTEETVSGLAAKFGAYVQGKSKIKYSFAAQGTYSSSIQSVTVDVNGQTLSGTELTTDVILDSGTLTAKVTARDSRGRVATKTHSVNVLPYSAPVISLFGVKRCIADGTLTDDGECVKILRQFTISPCDNKNDDSYKIEYRKQGETSWSTLTSGTGYSVSGDWISPAVISADYTYEFRLTVTDYFTSSTATASVDSSFSLIDYRNTGKGIAFGKSSEKDAFEVEMDAEFNRTVTVKQAYAEGVDSDGLSCDLLTVRDYINAPNNTWVAPSLLNGWKNRSGYGTLRYYKDLFGFVHIMGAVEGGTSTSGTGIFTLPELYRPTGNERFLVAAGTATSSGSAHVDVGYNGNVIIKTGISNMTWISLTGITFYAPGH